MNFGTVRRMQVDLWDFKSARATQDIVWTRVPKHTTYLSTVVNTDARFAAWDGKNPTSGNEGVSMNSPLMCFSRNVACQPAPEPFYHIGSNGSNQHLPPSLPKTSQKSLQPQSRHSLPGSWLDPECLRGCLQLSCIQIQQRVQKPLKTPTNFQNSFDLAPCLLWTWNKGDLFHPGCCWLQTHPKRNILLDFLSSSFSKHQVN